MVVLGAAQPGSPFTSKLPGSWIFGVPPAGSGPARHVLLGMALVYAGTIVVLSAWYRMVTVPAPPGDKAMARLYGVLALWVAPLVVSPPLFSRDVYTYGAEGRLVSQGVDPYTHGLQSVRSSAFFGLADPLWRHAHAPYGPVFFDIAGADASPIGHRLRHRGGVPARGAAGRGADGGVGPLPGPFPGARPVDRLRAGRAQSRWSCSASSGGMHNDALMLGLLVAGLALARARPPRARHRAVRPRAQRSKVPAVSSGWCSSAGSGRAPARPGASARSPMSRRAVLVALAVMAVVSEASGLGWAWLWNLSDPGKVNSWLDPATAVGLALSATSCTWFGAGMHTPRWSWPPGPWRCSWRR